MLITYPHSAYGAEAGVCALKFLPFGGLYICGGLAPKNLKRMKSEVFSDAFFDKGRVSDVLKQVPVKVYFGIFPPFSHLVSGCSCRECGHKRGAACRLQGNLGCRVHG